MSEQIKIDDTYTYEFHDGEVTLLRHGLPWIIDPIAAKAWIAAANEIEELRERAAKAEAMVERAFAHANNLASMGLVIEADTLRDRLKGRYRA